MENAIPNEKNEEIQKKMNQIKLNVKGIKIDLWKH